MPDFSGPRRANLAPVGLPFGTRDFPMLHEIQAETLVYERATDTARLRAPGAHGKGHLALLDANGLLVGIDLRGDDPRASVVMLGPHEAVATSREVRARVDGDDVVIEDARNTIRADAPSPYV
jgi:hypothetical protein